MNWQNIAIGVGLGLLGAVVTLGVTAFVLVRIPKDYFVDPKHRSNSHRSPAVRILLAVLRNLLGLVLVVGGIAMSVPGIPGQGLLTIFLGIMLLDFPGKYRLERAILRRQMILRPINAMRARFGKPALDVP